jgi:hypothetical protein
MCGLVILPRAASATLLRLLKDGADFDQAGIAQPFF